MESLPKEKRGLSVAAPSKTRAMKARLAISKRVEKSEKGILVRGRAIKRCVGHISVVEPVEQPDDNPYLNAISRSSTDRLSFYTRHRALASISPANARRHQPYEARRNHAEEWASAAIVRKALFVIHKRLGVSIEPRHHLFLRHRGEVLDVEAFRCEL